MEPRLYADAGLPASVKCGSMVAAMSVAVGRGKLGPHLTQSHMGGGLPSYQVASWSIQLFSHNTQRYRQDKGPIA